MKITLETTYPEFDLLEASIDRDLSYNNYQSLKPAKKGSLISNINFDFSYNNWVGFNNGIVNEAFVATKQVLGRPLVLSFYSNYWNGKGVDYLKQLSSLSKQVKSNGGNLVVVSAEAFSEDLINLVFENNLTLSFYFDTNNRIADQFGVYSDNDPIWNWFSGIDNNVPLLSTFVISAEKNVIFDHNYRDYAETLPANELLNAVSDSAYMRKLLLSA